MAVFIELSTKPKAKTRLILQVLALLHFHPTMFQVCSFGLKLLVATIARKRSSFDVWLQRVKTKKPPTRVSMSFSG
jgi:hypothetical protein